MTRRTLERLFLAASLPDALEAIDELIAKYHTLDGVFSADPRSLVELVGERAAMLIKLSAASVSRRAEEMLSPGARYDERDLRERLSAFFCGNSVERLYLLSYGERDELISVDLIGEGTVNAAGVAPRRLLDTAIRNRARTVVIAHNHPAGMTTPSEEDREFTQTVEVLFAGIGVSLRAHFTVAGNQCRKII